MCQMKFSVKPGGGKLSRKNRSIQHSSAVSENGTISSSLCLNTAHQINGNKETHHSRSFAASVPAPTAFLGARSSPQAAAHGGAEVLKGSTPELLGEQLLICGPGGMPQILTQRGSEEAWARELA